MDVPGLMLFKSFSLSPIQGFSPAQIASFYENSFQNSTDSLVLPGYGRCLCLLVIRNCFLGFHFSQGTRKLLVNPRDPSANLDHCGE